MGALAIISTSFSGYLFKAFDPWCIPWLPNNP
jgi:hypothetical protein